MKSNQDKNVKNNNETYKNDITIDNQNPKNIITKKPAKPPKPEDKPFEEFINDYLIPSFTKALTIRGIEASEFKLIEGERPVIGDNCWIFQGTITNERRFWLCFSEKKITSLKTISISESGSEPYTVESFLIDERKTTLALLVSRLLQRLNGQKWLSAN